MNGKELLNNLKIGAIKFQERLALFGEPVFVHKQDCAGSIFLNRTVERKPECKVIYRQCEACDAEDSYKEKYPDVIRIGW